MKHAKVMKNMMEAVLNTAEDVWDMTRYVSDTMEGVSNTMGEVWDMAEDIQDMTEDEAEGIQDVTEDVRARCLIWAARENCPCCRT